MGTVTSKETRRVSFQNNFVLAPPISMQKSIECEHAIDCLSPALEPATDLLYNEKRVEFPDDSEIDYWALRIDNLKREHDLINKIVETEFDKGLEITNKLHDVPKVTADRIQKLKPCFDWRAKILKCYEDNPHQTLMCSTAVQAFTTCVSNYTLEK